MEGNNNNFLGITGAFIDFPILFTVELGGMDIDSPISALPKTASLTIQKFKALGINTIADLLNYFPNRYEDYSIISPIKDLAKYYTFGMTPLRQDFAGHAKQKVTIVGTVVSMKNVYTRRGFKIQQAVITDDTGSVEVVWFNQQYLMTMIKAGQPISLAGTVKPDKRGYSMNVEEFEILYKGQDHIHTGRLVPVYSEKVGVSNKTIREKMFMLLGLLDNTDASIVPDKSAVSLGLVTSKVAYRAIHFPKDLADEMRAKERLSFDELFVLQLASRIIRNKWHEKKVSSQINLSSEQEKKLDACIKSLPFTLTGAQQRTFDEIKSDLIRSYPMNRLLQGDVGSGKTVIGALAAYLVSLNGYKTLFMAPTEVLALQHYETVQKLFSSHKDLSIAIYTGSNKSSAEELERSNIIIGTHALISSKFHSDSVGLVIVDEQHKFGVAQRQELKSKSARPHLLSMTATPIPRTVSLALYGELDVSIIDELPKGRLEIKSHVVPPAKRSDGYKWIVSEIKKHKTQVFIVCPLIEESESETMKEVKAAKAEFDTLSKGPLKYVSLALLHGRLASKEKEKIMNDFSAGNIDVLVSTPVVEVGVDIPNATIIIIEAAERFGLSQLHQLRGRVGRGDKQSYCFLFTEKTDDAITKRLQFFAKTNSGFELAEFDLKHRGSGDIFGLKQHGMSKLRIASFTDLPMVKKSGGAAAEFIKNNDIKDFPKLFKKVEQFEIEKIAND